MIRQSEKALGTIFYVPNDPEGQAFLKQMKKYLNRKCHSTRIRGRNENRDGRRGNRDLPLELSTYFAVYINTGENSRRRLYEEIKKTRESLQVLKLEVLRHSDIVTKRNELKLQEDARKLDEQLESMMLQLCKPRKIRVD